MDPTQSKQDQIDAELRRQIVTGDFPPGHRLPTWDALEKRFGVSRLTIMRGMAALHEDGFLTAARSRGTFVVSTPPHLFQYALAMPFWPDSPHPIPRFWRGLITHTKELQTMGPRRFLQYPGLDWGCTSSLLVSLADDAWRQRIAGILAIAHARFPILSHEAITRSQVPIVALTSVVTNPVVPTVGPDLPALVKRAIELLAETGRKRVAVLGDFRGPEAADLHELVARLDNAGIECRQYWRASVPWDRAEWAGTWIQTLFRLPKKDRPDALLITDEHLTAAAAIGLSSVVRPGDVPIIAHTNFPTEVPPLAGVTRLGFDLPRMIGLALNAIDIARAGRHPDQLTLVPPMLEGEFDAHMAGRW
jgi:hypothetical protein